MKTNHESRIAGFIALVSFVGVLACPSSVFALGFAMPDQDAFATARGNAFVATADDPAAVYYNPAGISQLDGVNISLGAYGIVYGSSYNGAAGSIDSQTQLEALPQVFLHLEFAQISSDVSAWALIPPTACRMEWPNNSPIGSPPAKRAKLTTTPLNPVIAWQIIPSLSIAAGPTLNYSQADLKEYPGFVNHFRGRDTDAGFNAGVLWHPAEQHSFGVTYRSATDMNY